MSETKHFFTSIFPYFTSMKGLPSFRPTLPKPVSVDKKDVKSSPILESIYKVNAARKSKVDDNTAKMQSIKQLGV